MSASTLLLQVLLAWALISMLLITALIAALISLARQLPRRRRWLWRLYYQVRWYGVWPRRQRRATRQVVPLNERETRAELAAVALAEYEHAKQSRSNHKRRAHPNDVFHY